MRTINLHDLKWLERRLAREFRQCRVFGIDDKYNRRIEGKRRVTLDRHARDDAKAAAYHAATGW